MDTTRPGGTDGVTDGRTDGKAPYLYSADCFDSPSPLIPPPSSPAMNIGAVIGIALGLTLALVVVVALLFTAYLCIKKYRVKVSTIWE